VLYDGQPDPARLWEFGAEAGVTTFGTSAGFIGASMKAGVRPEPWPALRAIGSTGSPLPVEGFEWVYERFPDVWLFSTSGGTDLCTAFVGGCPLLPVYSGELQARCLGAAVEAWSEDGRPLVNEVGELVVTRPMPSMPIYFWNDEGGARYRSSYFEMYPGVWRHGDWIKITDRGTAVIYGRSDSTINRGGVRMGTSEIYSAVEGVPEVLDSLVVDVEDEMILFVVVRDTVTDEMVAEIRRRVREHCSPRHVPDRIVQIPEVPRTLSNKKLEVPVKKILLGTAPESAASRDSLANPEALDWIADFRVRAS
jgi:acetoacetyl-CoA synthetase